MGRGRLKLRQNRLRCQSRLGRWFELSCSCWCHLGVWRSLPRCLPCQTMLIRNYLWPHHRHSSWALLRRELLSSPRRLQRRLGPRPRPLHVRRAPFRRLRGCRRRRPWRRAPGRLRCRQAERSWQRLAPFGGSVLLLLLPQPYLHPGVLTLQTRNQILLLPRSGPASCAGQSPRCPPAPTSRLPRPGPTTTTTMACTCRHSRKGRMPDAG
mmetsp:Transcript_2752/g.10855  ORF Transcript_2752/g.10855 Transcript_2752/m.10855 type:complete len:210 (-) Transcript_2752:1183-1812(-)